MLIEKPKNIETTSKLTELQKVALEYLPPEQVTKFGNFQHLIEQELENEAREPEMDKVLKDIFNALHERNTPKLLRALQGDRKTLFYAFKKQLETRVKSNLSKEDRNKSLTKKEVRMLHLVSQQEVSLVTIALTKD